MENITVSDDQNTITVKGITFAFNPIVGKNEEFNHCAKANCEAFDLCCELEDTVESTFPFPCLPENRKDGKNGNLRRLIST